MAAYCRVYDSLYLQADCQELGSATESYARQSSMGYLYLLYIFCNLLTVSSLKSYLCLHPSMLWVVVFLSFSPQCEVSGTK